MISIHEYYISKRTNTTVYLPIGAEIISFGESNKKQRNTFSIWAIIDPKEKQFEHRNFSIFETSVNFEAVRDNLIYLGTASLKNSYSVEYKTYHLFEHEGFI